MNMLHQIMISGGSQYLNRNIAFTLFLAVLLIARLAVKRLPRKYSYGLWALLGIKSLWDFGFRTVGNKITAAIGNRFTAASGNAALQNASAVIGAGAGETLANSANAGSSQMLVDSTNAGASQAVANAGNTASSQAVADAGNVGQLIDVSAIAPFIAVIWAVGLAAMIIWGIAGYVKLKAKTALSFASEIQNVYVCDYIDSPMVFGVVRPKIYIPSGVDIGELNYVIRHEKMHIKRHDTLFKAIAFAILAIYWMNPLAWIAFKLFNLDMELSCDEAVLRWESVKVKKDYGKWLVFFASKGKVFGPVPTAFGETDIEKRVKNMNDKKKTGVIAITLATVATIALILCMVVKAPQLFAEPSPKEKALPDTAAEETMQQQGDTVPETAGENETGTATGIASEAESQPAADTMQDTPEESTDDNVKAGDVIGILGSSEDAWVWPLESIVITARFGDRHTVLSDSDDNNAETEVHAGIDLAAQTGTPVLAAAAGTVEYAGYDRDRGNTVTVKTGDDVSYMYCHLDTVSVSAGDSVKAGQIIATVGSTGRSTGPHLHFSILKDGSYIDPLGTFYELAE